MAKIADSMHRKPAKRPRVSKLTRETAEIVALLRQLREKMTVVEEFEPDNPMLSDYQHTRGWGIVELRRIRAAVELALRRCGGTARERKVATEQLRAITLMESEFASEEGVDTAH